MAEAKLMFQKGAKRKGRKVLAKVAEEAGELNVAILQFLNKKTTPKAVAAILEEGIDVFIQLNILFSEFTEEEVEDAFIAKVAKANKNLSNET